MAPTIRIDDHVFEALQKRAKPFVDSPNDVLRRLLSLNGPSPGSQPLPAKHPGIVIDDPVMLIRIARRYRPGMSDDALYDATRRAWKVGKRRERARFACAVFEGVVREVYEIDRWSKASPRKGETFLERKRWEFVGRPAQEAIRSKYLGGHVHSYLPHGAQNPIRYVNC